MEGVGPTQQAPTGDQSPIAPRIELLHRNLRLRHQGNVRLMARRIRPDRSQVRKRHLCVRLVPAPRCLYWTPRVCGKTRRTRGPPFGVGQRREMTE